MLHRDPYPPIADHALLADCHSAALVTRDGTVDWACLRRFDAGSAFASLLDHDRGGHLVLRAVDAQETTRRYLDGTMVLETTVRTPTGAARIIDAFAMREGGRDAPRNQLLRVVEGVEGTVDVEVEVTPRFDYGGLRPWLRDAGHGRWTAIGGDDALVVGTDIELALDRQAALLAGRATVDAGERRHLTVMASWAHRIDVDAADPTLVDERLDETVLWWRAWSGATMTPSRHGDAVLRSALVLKSLTCAPSGAVVAAPTTSLPEEIGGERNWDYRFSWVRDSTLVLAAMAQVGHDEVAKGFRDFLMRAAAGSADDLQIMYGPYGARRLTEFELPLAGYRGSSPVRIGNGAADQRQLDVFGHVMDSAVLSVAQRDPIEPDEWRFLEQVVDAAADAWRQPDHGIWEMRGEPLHFVESKVMCWVALDRGIQLVEDGIGDADVDRWRTERDAVVEAVRTEGLDPTGSHFVQSFGSDQVDASLLRLPLTGFVDPTDPLMVATVAAVRDRLGTPEGFLRRYATAHGTDGLAGHEGVFLLCSFWLVEALALQGDVGEAEAVFEHLLALGNDLGLFAEEYDPATGELLGNFPQAFTHLGVIRAAFRLDAART